MTCSIDLRERVVNFVRSGGSKAEASRRFSVSRRTVYNWLKRDTLSPKAHGSRHRKIDKAALRSYIKSHPDVLLRELSAVFKVSIGALSRCLSKMGIVKKTEAVPGARSYEKSGVFTSLA